MNFSSQGGRYQHRDIEEARRERIRDGLRRVFHHNNYEKPEMPSRPAAVLVGRLRR